MLCAIGHERIAALIWFLGFAYPSGFWLGMSRDVYSRWFWTDETIVNFMAWAPGQPDNYNEHEACVYENSEGKWEDKSCNDRSINSSLCKRPAYTAGFDDTDEPQPPSSDRFL